MILTGDLLAALPTIKANSFDGCLCDPPYHLTTGKKGGSGDASVNLESPYGRARVTTGFMGKAWDGGAVAFQAETWEAILRVLKPGAMLLAFGGTRTHHRLMCAIEDAGFEIRDCMMWMHGQGFPKSLDISKAIDKAAGAEREVISTIRAKGGGTEHINRSNHEGHDYRPGAYQKGENILDVTAPSTDAAKCFAGYGTALKPAYEPIIIAMKPCEGTFAENALKWGVAGINIDRGRIEAEGHPLLESGNTNTAGTNCYGAGISGGGRAIGQTDTGRWPANVILDPESAAALDEQSGHLVSGNNPAKRSADKHRGVYAGWKGEQCLVHRGADSGGASRFFYCAKASRSERGLKNSHPTVKPLKLTEYLASLILPPFQGNPRRLLVPFAGSGSEMIGAQRAGWEDTVGIEREPEYVEIAETRLAAHSRLRDDIVSLTESRPTIEYAAHILS